MALIGAYKLASRTARKFARGSGSREVFAATKGLAQATREHVIDRGPKAVTEDLLKFAKNKGFTELEWDAGQWADEARHPTRKEMPGGGRKRAEFAQSVLDTKAAAAKAKNRKEAARRAAMRNRVRTMARNQELKAKGQRGR